MAHINTAAGFSLSFMRLKGRRATVPQIILASASPRRSELLKLIDVPFTVIPSQADEPRFDNAGSPGSYAAALARSKAAEVAARVSDGLILGADTIVTLDGRVFGKPVDAADATLMLRALSGRTHSVITGVHLMDCMTGREASRIVETRVTFRHLSPEQIDWYVASGEPMDKAGAYAIQGLGAVIVTRLHGCYFNVVGLPVPTVAEMLADFGWPIMGRAIGLERGDASVPPTS